MKIFTSMLVLILSVPAGFAQAQANDTATTERQAAAGVRHRPKGSEVRTATPSSYIRLGEATAWSVAR